MNIIPKYRKINSFLA